jgi:hypothetical protein
MKLKRFESFRINENDEDSGELLLFYGSDLPTTWYYIEDAVINGLFDEKLQIDEDVIEEFCENELYEENCNSQDLADSLIQDFDNVIFRLINYLYKNEIIDEKKPIRIEGFDEQGEEWGFEYNPD